MASATAMSGDNVSGIGLNAMVTRTVQRHLNTSLLLMTLTVVMLHLTELMRSRRLISLKLGTPLHY